jgi:hypothetical protein
MPKPRKGEALANPIDDEDEDLNRAAAEAQRVHERVGKELTARIKAESEGDDGEVAMIGWSMALADAMVCISATAHVPMGMVLEMVLRAYAAALADSNDVD